MVRAVFPDLGMGGGVAFGWQETSEVQVSVPAPLTVTQALLRHSLWVWGAEGEQSALVEQESAH